VFPEKADIGYRASNALIAHEEDVVIPAHAPPKMNYEGELVVIIGKQAKHLTEDNAFSCVFGYTIGNDVSERTWQARRPHVLARARTRYVQGRWVRGSKRM